MADNDHPPTPEAAILQHRQSVDNIMTSLGAQSPATQAQLERCRLISTFIFEILTDLSHIAALEIRIDELGRSIPGPLTVSEHEALGFLFLEIVRRIIPPEQCAILASRLMNSMPFPFDAERPLDNFSRATAYLAQVQPDDRLSTRKAYPGWFKPELFTEKTAPEAELFYSPEVEGHDKLNAVRDYDRELFFLKFMCAELVDKYFGMICDGRAPGSTRNQVRERKLRDLQAIADDLGQMHFFVSHDPDQLTLGEVSTVLEELTEKRKKLRGIRRGIFQAEKHLIKRERTILARPSGFKLIAYLSRFERAKMRKAVEQALDWNKSPQLNDHYSADILRRNDDELPHLEAQQSTEHDTCCVCFEDCASTDPRRVVSSCCKQVNHSECLLPWMFKDLDLFTCPCCRQEMDPEFFGQVLEIETRRMNVL
ncbi:hypothetical protein H2200_012783 [Cladophialophora chaetospira]|uniref:RING-type domain-containing protein n=1 Tax=Cladophialophora chaetospira TaxID=386627 RepID=A0AA38WWS6_9EURO|nr:hypothetical protein H2200_012783 [Cladophialophora chaetospira]